MLSQVLTGRGTGVFNIEVEVYGEEGSILRLFLNLQP